MGIGGSMRMRACGHGLGFILKVKKRERDEFSECVNEKALKFSGNLFQKFCVKLLLVPPLLAS